MALRVYCTRVDGAKAQWMTLFHQKESHWLFWTCTWNRLDCQWMSWIRFLGSCPTSPVGPSVLRVFFKHLEDSVQNNFIFHLPANLMSWSLHGPCSKPLPWKQLHHSVARGWSVLVMVAARELKEVLTKDRDIPSSVGTGLSREEPAGQRDCRAETIDACLQEITEAMDDDFWTVTYQPA